ncbi:MAG: hypothetical protein HQL52_08760 [Magnetococcales bacterium]|nr:hypothetical protein [Magnetococcales bacterium]
MNETSLMDILTLSVVGILCLLYVGRGLKRTFNPPPKGNNCGCSGGCSPKMMEGKKGKCP